MSNEAFLCPITHCVMRDPVTDTDGNTYERSAIEAWLKQHGTSPITRNPVRVEDLVPNRALAAALGGVPQEVATAPPAPDAASEGPLDITCVVDPQTSTLLISVIPPAGPVNNPADRIPVDVCCVIDISGSMANAATIKDEKGNTETHGLTLLDVVKHATRTVGGLLGPNDRLALVTFTDSANVVMPFTSMDTAGKKKLDTTTSSVLPQNMTNLWDGLVTGMDLLRNRPASDSKRNAALLLLTDGQPNVEPPRGHIPSLERYLDQFQGAAPFTVSTFGFGYNLDSGLLNDISCKTGGMYVFIPDSGLVGTVFVNTIANVLCTAATAVSVNVDCGRPILDADPNFNVTSHGAFASLGTVQFGQERNLTFRMGAADTKLAAEPPFVKLTYTYRGEAFTKVVSARVTEGATECQRVVCHAARRLFAASIARLCSSSQDVTASDVAGVAEAISSLGAGAEKHPLVAALLKDLNGEVKMGLIKRDNFTKWGSHFLPSIVRATLMQQCNNFKDHSVQMYGGALFKKLQDEGEKVFTKIAPPKPSGTRPAQGGAKNAVAPAAPVNMNHYYNCRGGCVLGSCTVSLAGGRRVAAAHVRAGDVLSTGATVRCVVRIVIPKATQLMRFPGGLAITPFHPIKMSGEWVFPADVVEATAFTTDEPFVFTYVLDGVAPAVLIDGIEVVSLGHGLKDNHVVQHDYLGTDKVINDLATLPGFNEGRVTVGAFRRNSSSMKIEGLFAHVNTNSVVTEICAAT